MVCTSVGLHRQNVKRIKVNTNNGSLSLTGLHAKTAGDNLCHEVLHELSPATIYAANIGINCQWRQFMPGDNLHVCRYTCLLSNAIVAKGAVVVECLSCGARGPGLDYRSRHLNFRDWACPSFKSRYTSN